MVALLKSPFPINTKIICLLFTSFPPPPTHQNPKQPIKKPTVNKPETPHLQLFQNIGPGSQDSTKPYDLNFWLTTRGWELKETSLTESVLMCSDKAEYTYTNPIYIPGLSSCFILSCRCAPVYTYIIKNHGTGWSCWEYSLYYYYSLISTSFDFTYWASLVPRTFTN